MEVVVCLLGGIYVLTSGKVGMQAEEVLSAARHLNVMDSNMWLLLTDHVSNLVRDVIPHGQFTYYF